MRGRSDMDINVFKIRRRASHVAFYILAIALFIVFLSPFIVMVTTSFKTLDDAFTVPVKILPREWTFSNFGDAVERIPYWRYMGNTAYITLLSLMGELIVVPLVAYSLAKIRWRGAGIVSGLLMATMMIPYTVTMIPLYRTWHAFGLTGTYVPLIAPHFVGHAYYIIIMRQFMKGIPNSLFEAAKIDGANHFTVMFKIMIPQVMGAWGALFIMDFITWWNDYSTSMLYFPNWPTLATGLFEYEANMIMQVNMPVYFAGLMISIVPVIALFIIFQDTIMDKVSLGGIKG